MSGLLIQCQDVWKRYGRKEALCGLNLRLESGKIVGLLGPNGSGKTTLIKVLNGLLQPDGGTVLIEGEAPGVRTKSMVSYLPDKPYFAGWMRVSDLFDLKANMKTADGTTAEVGSIYVGRSWTVSSTSQVSHVPTLTMLAVPQLSPRLPAPLLVLPTWPPPTLSPAPMTLPTSAAVM